MNPVATLAVLSVPAMLIIMVNGRSDAAVWPMPGWERATPEEMGMDAAKLREARDYALTGIEWAPVSEIIRKAKGSDNWPSTWADDDSLYTAYGDDCFSVRRAALHVASKD